MMTLFNQGFLASIALLIVAFGQPAWHPWLGLIAAACGYALFWRILLEYSSWITRCSLAAVWFCAVQLIQLSWFISHPYWYIYVVYFFLAIAEGIQFGILSYFIRPQTFKSVFSLFWIAAFWVLLEWSRLFLFSGFSFNPVGLSLAGNLYSLQLASIAGVFGLSFWVIFVNLAALRVWLYPPKRKSVAALAWLGIALFPYLFGMFQVSINDQTMAKNPPEHLRAVLVQTAFPVEETGIYTRENSLEKYVLGEWRQVLNILKQHVGKPIDLIALPEFVVPFGTYAFVFPLDVVLKIFQEEYGTDSIKRLPEAKWPLAAEIYVRNQKKVMVNNAYWLQAIANYFQSDVIAGLEDAEQVENGEIEYYSAALFFHPQKSDALEEFFVERYSKRILVPMGEYIPFQFAKELAARYGVTGSFTCGKEAKVLSCKNSLISPSICYEETFGHLMCEGRQKGAELLVNLTSDVWYPNSKLPLQHLEHARPRTVENGVPLIRACNTGITAAIDSSGRTVAILGGDHPEEVEWIPDSIYVDIPLYTYHTIYSLWGDNLLIICCLVLIGIKLLIKI